MSDGTPEPVKVECHLIVGVAVERRPGWVPRAKNKPRVRVSIGKPSLAPDEIAVKLNVKLPLALFMRPDLEAQIEVPPEKSPYQITPEIRTNIAEAIRQTTGLAVNLTVSEPEKEKQK